MAQLTLNRQRGASWRSADPARTMSGDIERGAREVLVRRLGAKCGNGSRRR